MFPFRREISAWMATKWKLRRTRGRRWNQSNFREERAEEEQAQRQKIRERAEIQTRNADCGADAADRKCVRKRGPNQISIAAARNWSRERPSCWRSCSYVPGSSYPLGERH